MLHIMQSQDNSMHLQSQENNQYLQQINIFGKKNLQSHRTLCIYNQRLFNHHCNVTHHI